MLRRNCLILLIILTVAATFGATVRITVTPDRGKRDIEVGDKFHMEITANGVDGDLNAPDQIPGAKVIYNFSSSSSQMSTVNGQTSLVISSKYTFTLRAEKEGTFTFGPVSIGGVRSNAVKYTIGKGKGGVQSQGVAPSSTQSQGNTNQNASGKPQFIGKGDGNLFLRANVSSTTVYEQQAIVYTVKLYTTYPTIKFIGASAAPKFEGFVTEESKEISSSLTYESYQGRQYATAVIARYIIFPQMTGALKVTGNTYTVSVDRREYYHDPYFGSMSYSTPLQLNVTPNDLVINVKSLPSPKPADFSGAVGSFRLTSQLNAKELRSNEAASIIYRLSGSGNIKYAQLPDLAALYPSQLEIYTPTTTQNVNVGSSTVSGTVTFDYSFMPLEEGNFRIPDVKLVYFNPASGKYETTVARGYNVTVGKGSGSSKSKIKRPNPFDSQLQKIDKSDLHKKYDPYVDHFPYWMWYVVPTFGLISAVIGYRRYSSLHADMVAFNSRRADKLARRRLKKAAAAMKRGDKDAFYDEILVALWGYLGDKLKMPTSELMRDNIRQVLSDKGIAQEDTDALISMIDDAEFEKYSSAGGKENLRNMYDKSIAMINRLDKAFKNLKS